MLRDQRAPPATVQRWLLAASLPGPVLGQGRGVGRRPTLDHRVPHDLRPGELEQVGAGVPVAENPLVAPGRVEYAEVSSDDPTLRLVRVTELRRLLGELPHVVVQRVECLAGHHDPVVRGPAPNDRVESDRKSTRLNSSHVKISYA